MFTSSSVEIKLEGCTLHAINNFRTEDKGYLLCMVC